MKTKNIILVLSIMILTSCNTKSQININDVSYKIDKITLKSEILGYDRELLIHLPNGYNNSNETYPVFITTDAEKTFVYAASTAGLLADVRSLPLIPKMIVIGIANYGEKERTIDFAPKVDSIPQSGKGELFIQFIEKELKPYIEKNYRTQPFWIFEGHSYIGMFAAHTLITKPNLFNAMIISSPGLQWIQAEINKDFPNIKAEGPKFIYLSRGENEPTEIAEKELENLKRFETQLSMNGNFHVKAEINSNEDHNSNKLVSIIHGLKFIFEGYITPKPYADCTMKEVETHYRQLSEKYGYQIPIPENIKKYIKK